MGKNPAPSGWDVFNQKTLYNAYKKRTKIIEIDMDACNKAKESDPEFYRDAASLQYGKAQKISEENIDKMVKELKDREVKRNSFSRRRKFHDEKDIDSINDLNIEHIPYIQVDQNEYYDGISLHKQPHTPSQHRLFILFFSSVHQLGIHLSVFILKIKMVYNVLLDLEIEKRNFIKWETYSVG